MITEIKEYLDMIQLDRSPQTFRSYNTSIEKFLSFIDAKLFEDISKVKSSTLREYQSFLSKEGVKNSSNNSYLRPLKALYNWLVEQEYLSNNPFNKFHFLKEGKKVPDYISDEELVAMIENCDRLVDKVVISTTALLGLRRNELGNIKFSDLHDQYIHIHGKGNKERNMPLREDLKELINEYLEERKHTGKDNSEYVFVSKMNKKFTGTSIYNIFQSAARKAGLPEERVKEIHPHLARHSYAIRLRRSSGDIRIVQLGMGHSDLQTTLIYDNVENSELAVAMNNQKSILR